MPDEEILRRQKVGDRTRSRRSFELHAKLREPLMEWYQGLNRLKPGHVMWELPEDGIGFISRTSPCLDRRYDLRVLDALVAELPQLN